MLSAKLMIYFKKFPSCFQRSFNAGKASMALKVWKGGDVDRDGVLILLNHPMQISCMRLIVRIF